MTGKVRGVARRAPGDPPGSQLTGVATDAPCSRAPRVPRGGGSRRDRRLDHSYNGANCCGRRGNLTPRRLLPRAARCLGSYCGANCYGLWAMLPHCIPCVFCFDCKFTCEPWLGCAWDGVTDQHRADKGDVVQVPARYGLRSYRMGSTTCDSPPCPLIVAVHSWMATSDSAVATYNLDAHLPAYGGAIVVYPDALGIPPFESCWNTSCDEPGGVRRPRRRPPLHLSAHRPRRGTVRVDAPRTGGARARPHHPSDPTRPPPSTGTTLITTGSTPSATRTAAR